MIPQYKIDAKLNGLTAVIMLNNRVANKQGKHPITLRLTYNRKRKYYSLRIGYFTIQKYEEIVNSRKKSVSEYQRKIIDVKTKVKNIIDSMEIFSFSIFEMKFKEKPIEEKTLTDLFNNKIKELNNNNKFQTADSYKSTLASLKEYKPNLDFEHITIPFLKGYEKEMLKNNKTLTTIGIYLRNLRAIVNIAISKKLMKVYPFSTATNKDGYQIRTSNKKKAEALSKKDVIKLFKYKPTNKNNFIAKQYWLLSYLCSGINIKDIAYLKYSDMTAQSIKFVRSKTKDTTNEEKIIEIALTEKAKDIINLLKTDNSKYIFPILNEEMTPIQKHNAIRQHIKIINKYLKVIAKEIGINENIRTYWARHSFATISVNENKESIAYVSEQLGHTNIKTTQNYLGTFSIEQKQKSVNKLL